MMMIYVLTRSHKPPTSKANHALHTKPIPASTPSHRSQAKPSQDKEEEHRQEPNPRCPIVSKRFKKEEQEEGKSSKQQAFFCKHNKPVEMKQNDDDGHAGHWRRSVRACVLWRKEKQ